MEREIKISIALLLFLCMLPMPYTFYILVRFFACIALGYLAYNAHLQDRNFTMLTFCLSALLLQPFLKIAFDKITWNTIDAIIGTGLLLNCILAKKLAKH